MDDMLQWLSAVPDAIWNTFVGGLVTLGGVFAKGWNDRRRDKQARQDAKANAEQMERNAARAAKQQAYVEIAESGQGFESVMAGACSGLVSTHSTTREGTADAVLESLVSFQGACARAQVAFLGGENIGPALGRMASDAQHAAYRLIGGPQNFATILTDFTTARKVLLEALLADIGAAT